MSTFVRFGAVGDIYLGGLVGEQIKRRGLHHPLEEIRPEIRKHDIVFGNLECPLTHNVSTRSSGPAWRAEPEVAGLVGWAGLTVLNLSNNHIGDCGQQGINDTVRYLQNEGIRPLGVGRGTSEARSAVIIEKKGIRVGFLAYCDSYIARSGSWGGAPIRENLIREDIAKLREQVNCIVVSLHHGIEYSDYPEPQVISLCRGLATAGADIILGHHPHVIQGFECHDGSAIVYSLGNFLADFGDPTLKREAYNRSLLVQRGLLSPDLNDTRTEEGVVFSCDLTTDGPRDFQFVPLTITPLFKVVLAPDPAKTRILRRLDKISRSLQEPDLPVFQDLERLSLEVAMQRATPSLNLFKRLHRIRIRHLKTLVQFIRTVLLGKPRNN